jgi:hypothetical protein
LVTPFKNQIITGFTICNLSITYAVIPGRGTEYLFMFIVMFVVFRGVLFIISEKIRRIQQTANSELGDTSTDVADPDTQRRVLNAALLNDLLVARVELEEVEGRIEMVYQNLPYCAEALMRANFKEDIDHGDVANCEGPQERGFEVEDNMVKTAYGIYNGKRIMLQIQISYRD